MKNFVKILITAVVILSLAIAIVAVATWFLESEDSRGSSLIHPGENFYSSNFPAGRYR